MAKFCTYCGKELKNGKTCDCKKPVSEEIKNTVSNMINAFIYLVKGMFIKPIDTMEEFTKEENYVKALVSLGIHALSVTIFICIFIKAYISDIARPSLYIMYRNNIPYLRIIIIIIMMVVITDALLAASTYIICKNILKMETSYKKMLTWLASPASMMSVIYLLSAFCILISMTLGMIILIAGSLLNVCYMYSGLRFTCKIDENKLGYVIASKKLIKKTRNCKKGKKTPYPKLYFA